ncbi:hypothetical protein J4Q44_G00312010 [Coregonus suidteri]|uniref:Uncharacterized protein n=1 Tax=Coregonus suidteri TaxID=861788 RepID=A0AAN8QGH7_9TELE
MLLLSWSPVVLTQGGFSDLWLVCPHLKPYGESGRHRWHGHLRKVCRSALLSEPIRSLPLQPRSVIRAPQPPQHCSNGATADGMRLDPVRFSMLVIGVSFACYAPSLNSLQDQAYRSAVVIEGEVRSSPENVSRDPYSVNVKVLDVWPVNSGGLEREQLVTVGDFGSEAPCTTVEENHRYIFFMDPTGEPLVFKASFAPLDASGTDLKKDVESVLCEDCGCVQIVWRTEAFFAQFITFGMMKQYRGRGAVSAAGVVDHHRHLCGTFGSGHGLCGGILQNQESEEEDAWPPEPELLTRTNVWSSPITCWLTEPNHPGPGPEEIPMVDYISKNAPTTECSIIQHGPEEATRGATWSIERTDSMNSDCQSGALSSSVGTSKCSSPTCMQARAQRAAYWGCSEGGSLQYGDSYDSLRDSPHSDRYVSALTTPARLSPVEFHYAPAVSPGRPAPAEMPSGWTVVPAAPSPTPTLPDREHGQPFRPAPTISLTTRPTRPRRSTPPHASQSGAAGALVGTAANGHVSQRAMGLRDYSSQSFSQSEEEEEEEEEGHGESTPFLSMQNMNMEPCERGCRSSTTPGATTDIRTHRAQGAAKHPQQRTQLKTPSRAPPNMTTHPFKTRPH